MMKEKYESLSAVELKAIAKARGLKNLSGLKKSEVVTRMLGQMKKNVSRKYPKRRKNVHRHRP